MIRTQASLTASGFSRLMQTVIFAISLVVAGAIAAAADRPAPLIGTVTVKTHYSFDALASRVEKAVSDHHMGAGAHAVPVCPAWARISCKIANCGYLFSVAGQFLNR